MKKFVYSLIFTGSFAFYVLFQNKLDFKSNFFDDDNIVTPPANIQFNNNTSLPKSTAGITPPPPNATFPQTPTTKPADQYKDGSYTGIATDAYYGYIQVKAVITGGKISDVIFLQYPNDRSTSRSINSQAMPYLKAEAIQSQSANVNIVSGASDSSQAFRQSLASALTQAKK